MWFFVLMSMMVFPKRPSSAVEEVETNSSSSSSDIKKLKNMTASKKAYKMQKNKRENLFERNKELMETQIQLFCDNSRLKQRIKVLRQVVDKMTHFCSHSDLQDIREIFQGILSHSTEFTELTNKAPRDQRAAIEKSAKHPKKLETSDKSTKRPPNHLKIEKTFVHQKDITYELSSCNVDELDTRSKCQKDAQNMQKRQPRNVELAEQKQQQNADVDLYEHETCVKDVNVECISLQAPGEAAFENVFSKTDLGFGMNKPKADQQNQGQNFQVHVPNDAKIVFVADSSLHEGFEGLYIITTINDGMCMSQRNISQCHSHSEMMNENCEMITLREDNLTPVDPSLSFQDSYKSLENENSANLSTQKDVYLKNNCLLNVDGDDSTLTLGATEVVISGTSISDKDKIKEKKSPIEGKRSKPMKFKTGLVKRYREWEMSSYDSRESTGEAFVPQCIKT